MQYALVVRVLSTFESITRQALLALMQFSITCRLSFGALWATSLGNVEGAA
jgi:hypothetical protein